MKSLGSGDEADVAPLLDAELLGKGCTGITGRHGRDQPAVTSATRFLISPLRTVVR